MSKTLFSGTSTLTFATQLIFALSSMLAYLSRTDIAIKQLEKLSWDWIKMDCSGGKCYGLLAVSYSSRLSAVLNNE